jgi:hypothetical protein
MNQLTDVQKNILQEIQIELKRRPLEINKYRNSGIGRSVAFGIVSKRCMPPDLSRANWMRPYLAFLLERYGKTLIDFEFTSITVNQNYKSTPHRDKGNEGQTYIIAFGNFSGGELCVEDMPDQDIKNGFIFNGATQLHSTMPWIGERFSLVFYKAKRSPLTSYIAMPIPTVLKGNQTYQLHGFGIYKDNQRILNLPHPLAGRSKNLSVKKILL